jgi:hypothetical protein
MVVLILLQSAYALYRPAPDNDLLFYAATVHQWEGMDSAAIHAASYADIRAFLAPEVYERMISENDYMRAVTADPEALVQQIPFYSVKPLFPAVLLVLDRIGFPVGLGALLIAIVSYAALSLLVFFWFRRHLGPWWSLALAGLLTLSPPFSTLPSLESPDALGALFTVAGLFVLVELRRVDAAMAIYLLAILARPNAVIAETTMAAALVVLGRSSPMSLSPARGAAWIAAGIALVFGLSLLSRNYGVATLFYFAVVEYLPYPAAGPPPLALTEVLRLYAFKLVNLVVSPIPLFAFVGVLAIRVRASTLRMIRSDPIAMIILATFAAIALGWLYYPNEPERILVGGFLSCALLLVVAVARALNGVPDLALDSRAVARSDRLVGAGSIMTSDGSAVAASVVPPG